MSELLPRGPRTRPQPGRFVHTGLTPNPIDTWALARWNAGIQAAREAYDRLILQRGFGNLFRPCTGSGCNSRTQHDSGLCFECRRLASNKTTGAPHCTNPGCKTRTLNPSGLCFHCARDADRRRRAQDWDACKRPGCGRATQSPDRVCARCWHGDPPNGPGNHWSHRYKNLA